MKNNYRIINLNKDNFKQYINRLSEIENQSFPEAWTKQAYIKDICTNDNAHYVAVVSNNILIAYANYWLIADEGNINNVAVSPEYRKQGFGTILMKELIANCKKQNARAMTLEVRAGNKNAIKLYEKLGFKNCSTRPGYYENNGEDAVIMWLFFN